PFPALIWLSPDESSPTKVWWPGHSILRKTNLPHQNVLTRKWTSNCPL
ncbi:hypothetical protein CSUI_009326, partial [Cystoisospora suis]